MAPSEVGASNGENMSYEMAGYALMGICYLCFVAAIYMMWKRKRGGGD